MVLVVSSSPLVPRGRSLASPVWTSTTVYSLVTFVVWCWITVTEVDRNAYQRGPTAPARSAQAAGDYSDATCSVGPRTAPCGRRR